MGRFALELPDQMHELLTKHLEWKVLIQYGIGFCIDSGVLDELDLRILNLVLMHFYFALATLLFLFYFSGSTRTELNYQRGELYQSK